MSIFYLQQALREDDIDIKDDEELLKALNIMADVDKKIVEHETL